MSENCDVIIIFLDFGWFGAISDFRISGQSLIKWNCHNSRTSDDIDIKLEPVTKLDTRNKAMSTKIDNDAMSENCDVIIIFLDFGWFGAISDFRISGQSLIKWNCHNSRTSDDIDIKLEPVTKLDTRNKAMSTKIDNDAMSKNCDVIIIFLDFGWFGAVRRPDSGLKVCKSYFSINSNLLP